MEEFEKLVAESFQSDLYPAEGGSDASTTATSPQSNSAESRNETLDEAHVPAGKPQE